MVCSQVVMINGRPYTLLWSSPKAAAGRYL